LNDVCYVMRANGKRPLYGDGRSLEKTERRNPYESDFALALMPSSSGVMAAMGRK